MHPPAQIEGELRARALIQGAGFTEEIMYIEGSTAPMFAAVTLPLERAPSAAIVICPSVFELATLQPTELLLLRRAAADGYAGVYIQPPGVGESGGDPDGTMVAHRTEAARAGRRYLAQRVPGIPLCFFGARFGAAIATRAAEPGQGSGLIVWDPVFEVAGYMKQIRRLARISAVAGGSAAFRDPLHQLRESGRASILGHDITIAQLDDLSTSEVNDYVIEGPALVVTLSDRTGSAVKERFIGASDLELIELEGRDLAGLGMSVREAPRAIAPTLEWLRRKFG